MRRCAPKSPCVSRSGRASSDERRRQAPTRAARAQAPRRGHADSDIDLGLYYREDAPLDLEAVREIAERFSIDGAPVVTDRCVWGQAHQNLPARPIPGRSLAVYPLNRLRA